MDQYRNQQRRTDDDISPLFYPADVDISVPYVAPLNLEYVDPRLDKFLNRLGTAKSGVKALLTGRI